MDILRSPDFAGSIDLRNIICLIDPQDFGDPRWRNTEVFQDQIQLADIVALNWTDVRSRELVDQCREWVDSFRPPKQLVFETSLGEIDPAFLDMKFETDRFPLFADAHPAPSQDSETLPLIDLTPVGSAGENSLSPDEPSPGCPTRFRNCDESYDACGWIFHVDDIFDRDKLLDLLGYVHPIVRLKGVFRCRDEWWMINRAKDGTRYVSSAYRRDSRLEIILQQKTSGWEEFEKQLLQCLSAP